MRIIHCFRSPVGGIFRHVRDLIEDHVAAGHEVGILCDSSTGGAHEDRLFQEIAPLLSLGLHRIPINRAVRPSDAATLWKSYQHIKNLKPDIIHGHGAKGGLIARLAGTMLKSTKHPVARLYSPHGGSLHYDKSTMKGRFFFLVERVLERMTDAICFVCDYERQTYFEKVAHPLPLYLTIYNGVRGEEFEPIDINPEAADFLFIGMMRDLKGPQVFIEALRLIVETRRQPVRAHMVGDGPDQPRYLDLIKSYGLQDMVTMHGALPARSAFKMARCVVIPSLAEAMPYIVLEAVAAKRPIIASRVGGIPEILGAGSSCLVNPNSAQDLAEKMMEFMSGTRDFTMKSDERANFKQRYSSQQMSQSMLNLYSKLTK